MIISASRRTDIPALYSEWFYKRLRDGFAETRNPVNRKQVKTVSLLPNDVSGFVFWTKNPEPMLPGLDALKNHEFYFQFTLTPYGADIEPNLPDKKILKASFKKLSASVGADRVILRYDPVLFNDEYDFGFHLRAFADITGELKNFTRKVTISFIDEKYRGVRANVKNLNLAETGDEKKLLLAGRFAQTARENGLAIESCAGKLDFAPYGIGRAKCVDASYFSKLRGKQTSAKDKSQRPECGCAPSVDIGAYNTCVNGCLYCYANYIQKIAAENYKNHDASSKTLI